MEKIKAGTKLLQTEDTKNLMQPNLNDGVIQLILRYANTDNEKYPWLRNYNVGNIYSKLNDCADTVKKIYTYIDGNNIKQLTNLITTLKKKYRTRNAYPLLTPLLAHLTTLLSDKIFPEPMISNKIVGAQNYVKFLSDFIELRGGTDSEKYPTTGTLCSLKGKKADKTYIVSDNNGQEGGQLKLLSLEDGKVVMIPPSNPAKNSLIISHTADQLTFYQLKNNPEFPNAIKSIATLEDSRWELDSNLQNMFNNSRYQAYTNAISNQELRRKNSSIDFLRYTPSVHTVELRF